MPVPSLANTPPELIIHFLLPNLAARDVLALGSTNKRFAELTSDEILWEERCEDDFNFTRSRLSRSGEHMAKISWKTLYKKLTDPIMYGWGSPDNGRLGRPDIDENTPMGVRSVSMPVILPSVPGTQMSQLIAGGWSMHALDTKGRIHVLGALDGSRRTHDNYDFDHPSKQAHLFHRLLLPARFKSLSCSVNSTVALDTSDSVWDFNSWAYPVKIRSPVLNTSSPDTKVVQVECGGQCRAVLMQSGAVYIWWKTPLEEQSTVPPEDLVVDTADEHKVVKFIPCVPVDRSMVLLRMPPIPYSTLRAAVQRTGTESDAEEGCATLQLVKVSLAGNTLIGLTNQGHLLRYAGVHNRALLERGSWEYLPKFSEPDEIRKCLPAKDVMGRNLRMTNIASNPTISQVIVYRPASSPADCSTVLCGRMHMAAQVNPTVIPELQNLPIISISMGDMHAVALTADGRVFTWGNDRQGLLGLGDSMVNRATQVPREVQLFGPQRMFCVGVTAMGWHSGVLTIDLEE